MFLRLLPCAFAVVFFLATGPRPCLAQTPELLAGARSSAHTGLKAFDAGDFEKALDYFTRAESLVHATPHLLYIARSRVELGRLVAAQEAYLKIVREPVPADAQSVFKETLSDAEHELAELEPRIPRITVVIDGPPGAEVEVKRGVVVVPAALVGIEHPIDPGNYMFEASGVGFSARPEQVVVTEGGAFTVSLKLIPVTVTEGVDSPSPEGRASWSSGKAIGGYAAIGVGAAGLIIGPIFLSKSGATSDEASELYENSGCPGETCEQSRVEELDRSSTSQKVVGIVGLSVGAAALVTGVTLLILNANDKRPETTAGLSPWFSGDLVGVQGVF